MSETSEMREILGRIDERTKQTQEDVDLLKHVILEGNGTPAITVQVATMNQRLKTIEDDKNDSKIPRHVAIGLIISIILAAFGTLAGFMQ